jgi:hypothetical protein
MALLAAAQPVKILSSDLPLVVIQADYDAKRSAVLFSVRNDGSVPIVAWSVGMKSDDYGGRPMSEFIIDAYEHAAGFKAAPAGNRVIAPGETAQGLFVVLTRPGAPRPRLIEVQTRAVVLESNQALGDPQTLQGIFKRRTQWHMAWTEIRSLLDSARAAGVTDAEAFDRAVDALKAHQSDKDFVGEASRNCLKGLVAVAESDKPRTLELAIQEADRRAAAAERFAKPLSDGRE